MREGYLAQQEARLTTVGRYNSPTGVPHFEENETHPPRVEGLATTCQLTRLMSVEVRPLLIVCEDSPSLIKSCPSVDPTEMKPTCWFVSAQGLAASYIIRTTSAG
jgi:hypothetical protein